MAQIKGVTLFSGTMTHGKVALGCGCVMLTAAFAGTLSMALGFADTPVTPREVLGVSAAFGFGLYTTIRGAVEMIKG